MRNRAHLIGSAAYLAAVIACGGSDPAVPAARFANQPIVWNVDDHTDTRVTPPAGAGAAFINLDFYSRSFQRPLIEGLALRRAQRARGANALDELPDSTWFTNRIGRQTLTPEQVGTGPLEHDSPEAFKPWTVRSTKYGGAASGLIITDVRGVKYMLKFDSVGLPEVVTGADVVANRLLWACGYHVAEDRVVYFQPEDLVLAPHAMIKNQLGEDRKPFGTDDLAHQLAQLDRTPDGRIRAIASRWIAGTTLGPTTDEGVRRDDPNDRIPHELRRDLRGAFAIFEWLDSPDFNLSNAIDVLVTDPRDASRHFVEHYRLDFDSALAGLAAVDHSMRVGYVNSFDWLAVLADTFTFGFNGRPWQHPAAPKLRGVSGAFTADHFDPGAWKPNLPVAPFDASDRFDQFWGAKIVARFTREQIHAAVEAARYTDPRAVEYLTDTLVARQRAVVAYWLSQVAPLDAVSVTDRGLCFDDLAIRYGLAPASATRYVLTSRDRAGRQDAQTAVAAVANGSTCAGMPALALGHRDDYTIVEIVTTRPGSARTMYVHVARNPVTHRPRVIGIWRV